MATILLESFNLRDAEATLVLYALKRSKSMREAARNLGISPRTLKRIVTRLEICWEFPRFGVKGTPARPTPSMSAAPPVEVSQPQDFPVARRVEQVFSWLATLVPKRIWNEDVGDALEVIAAMERAGCSTVKIWSKILATFFWALYAALRGR